jgi:hypothetical protein
LATLLGLSIISLLLGVPAGVVVGLGLVSLGFGEVSFAELELILTSIMSNKEYDQSKVKTIR